MHIQPRNQPTPPNLLLLLLPTLIEQHLPERVPLRTHRALHRCRPRPSSTSIFRTQSSTVRPRETHLWPPQLTQHCSRAPSLLCVSPSLSTTWISSISPSQRRLLSRSTHQPSHLVEHAQARLRKPSPSSALVVSPRSRICNAISCVYNNFFVILRPACPCAVRLSRATLGTRNFIQPRRMMRVLPGTRRKIAIT